MSNNKAYRNLQNFQQRTACLFAPLVAVNYESCYLEEEASVIDTMYGNMLPLMLTKEFKTLLPRVHVMSIINLRACLRSVTDLIQALNQNTTIKKRGNEHG